MRILRKLLGRSAAQISKARAVEVARSRCEQEGWPWIEPIHVNEELWAYHVMTNARNRGGNVNIRVDRQTGEVRSAQFARR
jgi:hypothetical protein